MDEQSILFNVKFSRFIIPNKFDSKKLYGELSISTLDILNSNPLLILIKELIILLL